MYMSPPGEITQLLMQLKNGDRSVEDQLIPLVYGELRRLARHYMRMERQGHTLQPTALVHEAYLKLIRQNEVDWQSRAHFFGLSAQLMRRILVDYARRKRARERPSARRMIPIEELLAYADTGPTQLLAIDEALNRLAERFPRQSKVVEMRFFAGLSEEEIAEALGISIRTVKSDWKFARAWLYAELSKDLHDGAGTPGRVV